jgi:hypothetical protein
MQRWRCRLTHRRLRAGLLLIRLDPASDASGEPRQRAPFERSAHSCIATRQRCWLKLASGALMRETACKTPRKFALQRPVPSSAWVGPLPASRIVLREHCRQHRGVVLNEHLVVGIRTPVERLSRATGAGCWCVSSDKDFCRISLLPWLASTQTFRTQCDLEFGKPWALAMSKAPDVPTKMLRRV